MSKTGDIDVMGILKKIGNDELMNQLKNAQHKTIFIIRERENETMNDSVKQEFGTGGKYNVTDPCDIENAGMERPTCEPEISELEKAKRYIKDLEEANYKLSVRLEEKSGVDFGEAIYALKLGARVTRKNWNAPGQFVMLCDESGPYTLESTGRTYSRRPYMYLKAADDTLVPWTPSQSDTLAEDWIVL